MEKVTHEYLQKNFKSNDFIDFKGTNEWLELRLSSHLERYAAAIMEQEINTEERMKRKEKDPKKKHKMDTKCRICGKSDESIYHLICSCSVLAPTM